MSTQIPGSEPGRYRRTQAPGRPTAHVAGRADRLGPHRKAANPGTASAGSRRS